MFLLLTYFKPVNERVHLTYFKKAYLYLMLSRSVANKCVWKFNALWTQWLSLMKYQKREKHNFGSSLKYMKFTEEQLCSGLFLIKLQLYSLQLHLKNCLTNNLSCEFCKIFLSKRFSTPAADCLYSFSSNWTIACWV